MEYQNKIIILEPNNGEALTFKGDILYKLDRVADVIKYYDMALALDSMGEYLKAIECYDTVLVFDPNDDYVLGSKGETLCNLCRFQDAIRYFEKSLAINPDDLYILSLKADAYMLENTRMYYNIY